MQKLKLHNLDLDLARAVRTGYPARVGPAHGGLGLLRAGPKRPGR